MEESLPVLKGVTFQAHSVVADPQKSVINKIRRDTATAQGFCAGFTGKWRLSSMEIWWWSLVQIFRVVAFATPF